MEVKYIDGLGCILECIFLIHGLVDVCILNRWLFLDGFWMIKQGWNVYFVVEVPPLYFELMAILDGISMYLVGLECIF